MDGSPLLDQGAWKPREDALSVAGEAAAGMLGWLKGQGCPATGALPSNPSRQSQAVKSSRPGLGGTKGKAALLHPLPPSSP